MRSPKSLRTRATLSPEDAQPYLRFQARRALQQSYLKKSTAQDQLVDRILQRLDTLQDYLDDDAVWFEKLARAPLRDIAIMEGIWVDKLQILQGKATQILGVQHQSKLDELLPALQQVLKQRGLTVTTAERAVTVVNP